MGLNITDPQSLNRYSYTLNNPLKYVDPSGRTPLIPLLIAGFSIGSKIIDYGWTAYDAWQSTQVLNDPNASAQAKSDAQANLALAGTLEAMDPDEFSPISLPTDDLARLSVLTGLRRAGKEGGEGAVPLGFNNAEEFAHFGSQLKSGLEDAGYGGAQAAFQGSSVTGVKYTTGAAFDAGRTSDYDIALAGGNLFLKAKEAGIPLRGQGTRTAPLNVEQLRALGLMGLRQELSKLAGRDVNFMVFESLDDALERGSSIVVP